MVSEIKIAKSSVSPTQRATKILRDLGHTYQIVETWNYFAKKRQDLWGIGDILVMDGLPGSFLIQVSSASGHSARVKKALAEPRLLEWLEAGNRFSVWTFGLRGKAGARKKWELRETVMTVKDFRDEK